MEKRMGRPPIDTTQQVEAALKRFRQTDLSNDELKKECETTGHYVRRLWMLGRYTPASIIALVELNYGKRLTRKAINWHYHDLLKMGVEDVPPWKEPNMELDLK